MSRRQMLDDESDGATELRGAAGAVAEDHERRAAIARETGEPHGGRLGEGRRPVEHDEGEGPAPEQDVGAPCGARRIMGADDPHAVSVSQVHPVACIQGALRIDDGDPAATGDRGLDDGAHEGGLPAPRAPDDLREPPARQSASRQHQVERRDPGGNRGRAGRGRGKQLNEFGEREGHAE